MSEMFAQIAAIASALVSMDSFEISEALRTDAAWIVGAVFTLAGGAVFLLVYRVFPAFERYFERTIMVSTYLLIGIIIFVEVFRRFVLNVQAPWSTTLPPFLFLIMTWAGCAYNVKLRTHLAFSEFRLKMPRHLQFASLTLDSMLWVVFSWVVIVTSTRVVANSASNFQILLGTDDVLQWWFLTSVPLSFMLIVTRSMEHFMTDLRNFYNGEELIKPVAIGSTE